MRVPNNEACQKFAICVVACMLVSQSHSVIFAAEVDGFFADVHPATTVEWEGNDTPGHISDDGRTLYIGSDGPHGPGEFDAVDLYVATRESISLPFGEPRRIDELSREGFQECCPYVSPDESTIYFTAEWPEDSHLSIYKSTRKHPDEPWSEPSLIDVGVDGDTWQFQLSRDELDLYVTVEGDVLQAWRDETTEPFGTLQPVLVSPHINGNQSLSSDEKTIFYWNRRFVQNEWFLEIGVAQRDDRRKPFGAPVNIDDFGLGSDLGEVATYLGTPVISPDWPAAGSRLYFGAGDTFKDFEIYEATWMVLADLNSNGVFDAADIDELTFAISNERTDRKYDINLDELVNDQDRIAWVHDLKNTYLGDGNLDGEFNSSDFVAVFTAGKYESDQMAGWAEGDWDGNMFFDSADFVAAFTDGGYEQGPRDETNVVPEPASVLMLMAGVGLSGIAIRRRYVVA